MSKIHHFEITSYNLTSCLSTFVHKLGFRVLAHRTDNNNSPVAFAVIMNSIVVILRDINHYTNNRGFPLPLTDWVSNLTLLLSQQDFDKITTKACNNEDMKVIQCQCRVTMGASEEVDVTCSCPYSTSHGTSSFMMESPFPCVTHTLITGQCDCLQMPSSNQGGLPACLPVPGLIMCPVLSGAPCRVCEQAGILTIAGADKGQPLLDYIDHVTFACDVSTTPRLVKWYSDCLNFNEVSFINTQDGKGFVLEGDNGIYLSAMHYWMCSEVCVEGGARDQGKAPIQLIFAEPLSKSGPNQVQSFIDGNGCPGIQHIAFHTNNITQSVSVLRDNGLSFIAPPQQYYSMMKERNTVIMTGEDVNALEANNILIDVETHNTGRSTCASAPIQYLLQVFSHSLFNEDTFFVELITRYGEAKGFGAGNIAALWKALDVHLKSKNSKFN